jgi:hypothetical protein
MTASAWKTIGFLGVLSALLVAQGCREEEQDQILIHEKGVYQGQADEGLASEQVQDLRSRARSQKF